MTTIALIILCGLCAAARRAQGLPGPGDPVAIANGDTIWKWKRNTMRMPVLWLPITAMFTLVGVLMLGLPWLIAFALATVPGLWSWMPGRFNTFLIKHAIDRLTGGNIDTVYTEILQGYLAGLVASLLMVAIP